MSEPIITAVHFRDETPRDLAWLGRGRQTVLATFSDGHTRELFSFYGDEHTFSEGSFAGLTEGAARSRFHEHDVAFLLS